MKTIKLSKNQITLVDDEDFEYLNQWKWMAKYRNSRNKHLGFYACRQVKSLKEGSRQRVQWMHKLILGIDNLPVKGDHINGEGLDNRRINLRAATNVENQRNTRTTKSPTSSKYKGVMYAANSRKNPWRAYIHTTVNEVKINYHLGVFRSQEDAAKAYDKKAKELFGEFANLNFPGDNHEK